MEEPLATSELRVETDVNTLFSSFTWMMDPATGLQTCSSSSSVLTDIQALLHEGETGGGLAILTLTTKLPNGIELPGTDWVLFLMALHAQAVSSVDTCAFGARESVVREWADLHKPSSSPLISDLAAAFPSGFTMTGYPNPATAFMPALARHRYDSGATPAQHFSADPEVHFAQLRFVEGDQVVLRISVDGGAGSLAYGQIVFVHRDGGPYDQPFFSYSPSTVAFDTLSGKRVSFIPNGQPSEYDVLVSASGWTTSPPISDVGDSLTVTDDGFHNCWLPAGRSIPFYGVSYAQLFMNGNGNITFNAGDSSFDPTDHGDDPRISYFFADLDPSAGASVDHLSVTDEYVLLTLLPIEEFGASTPAPNYIQIQVHHSGSSELPGRIDISYGTLTATTATVGLSRGTGSLHSVDFSQL